MITISSGALSIDVLPELGASIAAFRFVSNQKCHQLMRQAPQSCTNASDTNFLLAPYSNRIRDGKFRFAGQTYQLAYAEKHAIHGDIRSRVFDVVGQTSDMLLLELDSRKIADFNYPFALRYRIQYQVSDTKLRCVINIKNLDSCIAPVGGGFHPYFPRSLQDDSSAEEVEIQFDAKRIYLYEDLPIPNKSAVPVPDDFSFTKRRELREGIDHCYGAWDGELVLRWQKSNVWMRIQGLDPIKHLVLYTPKGEKYFAAEPVSNCTDAFNLAANGFSDTGILELAPKEECRLEMNILVGSSTN